MSQHSVLVPAKVEIIARLKAKALAGVDVDYAVTETTGVDAIYFGEASGTHEVATLKAGRKTRREAITLDLVIDVLSAGKTQQEADERMVELFGAVEDVCADDPSLSGLVQSVTVGAVRFTPGMVDGGRASRATVGINLVARLT